MQNLRQYYAAGQMYLEENNKLFPEPDEWLYTKTSDSKEHPIGCRWHDREMSLWGQKSNVPEEYKGKLWKYIKETGIRPCPIFRDCAKARGCENTQHNIELEINPQYSYTMNGYLGSKQEAGVQNESEVRAPAEVFFFAEENSWSIRPDHPKYSAKWLKAPLSTRALDDTALLITPTPQAKDCFATYHGASSKGFNRGSGNVVFIDGHVESVRVESQLRVKMHGSRNYDNPAGNMSMAWASKTPPPGGWDAQ
jgi:prepilin-type processing-associated H-X9-DG protein